MLSWVFSRSVYLLFLCVFQGQQMNEAEVVMFSVPSYACQRRTTLDNHNAVLTVCLSANTELSYKPVQHWHLLLKKFNRQLVWNSTHETLCFLSQDALALLAENAELSEEEGRAVAFRRAAAVLKTLPKLVTNMAQLRGLPCLGEHSLRVIKASRQCLYWLAF